MPAAFISYSRRDKASVQRLHDALIASDYQVWVDWEDIPASAEWMGEIKSGIGNADGFVYVISPDSVASEVCGRELSQALELNKRVVPVVVRDADMAMVPEAAAALNWVFLRDSDDFEAGVKTLTTALETDLEHVRTHTRIGVEATRWEQSGRDSSQLLRGSDLAAAEAWLAAGAGKSPEATALQREFLLAGRQAATRRQRTILGAVTVALAVAIVLSIVALAQRSTAIQERNTAQARLLDSEAQSEYATDPEVSVILASRAARLLPDAQSAYALRDALLHSRIRYRIPLAAPSGGDAAWSPDGSRLLLTSPKHWTRIYAAGSTRPLLTLPGPTIAGVTHWDAHGDRLIIGGAEPAVYDARTGGVLRHLPQGTYGTALTPDGHTAVTADLHAIGHVINVQTGRELATFRTPGITVLTCFALSPDGRVAAVCGAPRINLSQSGTIHGTLLLYDVATGRRLRAIRALSEINSVDFNANGRQVMFTQTTTVSGRAALSPRAVAGAVGQPGTLIYGVRGSGPPLHAYPGPALAAVFGPGGSYETIAYATTGTSGLTADNPGGATVHVVQLFSGRSFSLTGATDNVTTLQFVAGGAYLLAAGADGTTRIYDTSRDGTPIITLAGDTAPVTGASFRPDDTAVATSSDDGTARVWQALLPKPDVNVPGQEGTVTTAGFSRRGDRVLVTGGSTGPGSGRILAAANLRTLARFRAPAGQSFVGARWFGETLPIVAVSGPAGPNGITPLAAELYDSRTGALRATMHPTAPPISYFVVSPDAPVAASLGARAIADTYDVANGRHLATLRGETTPAGNLAVSRDGATVAVAHYPALPASISAQTQYGPVTVQLFSARTGRVMRTITGPTVRPQTPGTKEYAPLTLAFSPAGDLLAVSGADQTVRVYRTATGRPVTAPLSLAGRAEGSFASSLAFSPDGRLLIAGAALGCLPVAHRRLVAAATFLGHPGTRSSGRRWGGRPCERVHRRPDVGDGDRHPSHLRDRDLEHPRSPPAAIRLPGRDAGGVDRSGGPAGDRGQRRWDLDLRLRAVRRPPAAASRGPPADHPPADPGRAPTLPCHRMRPSELPPCDLVMKGGVTSGIVYPGAVAELANRYRFANLGGTSAGAVAAAMAAACEYARQGSDELMLPGILDVAQDARRPGFFLDLFQPTAQARPLLWLVFALAAARGSHRRQSLALARAAVRHRPAQAAGALAAAAALLALGALAVSRLPIVLALVLAVVAALVVALLVAGAVLGPLVAIARGAWRSLPQTGFGVCSGLAADGAPDALTDWLHAGLQRCAGLPPDRPLTFSMLRSRGITLRMVATDLGLARPVTMPFSEQQYLFAPAELTRLFPGPVVDHVLRAAGVGPEDRDSTRTWFLPADELPVVIGVRISASVPVLLSSLRLYTAAPEADGPIESYMTDGGLTSNFPIHFFDDWLPSHPTFGLDLVAVPAVGDEPVFMPAGDEIGHRLAPRPVTGLGGVRRPAAGRHAQLARRGPGRAARIPRPDLPDPDGPRRGRLPPRCRSGPGRDADGPGPRGGPGDPAQL